MKLHIADMTCGGCVRGVTEAVQTADPAAHLSIDLPERLVTITTDRPAAPFLSRLTEAGFTPVQV